MFKFARTGAKALLLAAGTAGFVALGAGVASADIGGAPDLGGVAPAVPLSAVSPQDLTGTLSDVSGVTNRVEAPHTLPAGATSVDPAEFGKVSSLDPAALAGATSALDRADVRTLRLSSPAVDGAKKTAGDVGAKAKDLTGAVERPEDVVNHLSGAVEETADLSKVQEQIPSDVVPQETATKTGGLVKKVEGAATNGALQQKPGALGSPSTDPSNTTGGLIKTPGPDVNEKPLSVVGAV